MTRFGYLNFDHASLPLGTLRLAGSNLILVSPLESPIGFSERMLTLFCNESFKLKAGFTAGWLNCPLCRVCQDQLRALPCNHGLTCWIAHAGLVKGIIARKGLSLQVLAIEIEFEEPRSQESM